MPRSRPSARAAVLLSLVLLAGCSPDQTVPPPSGAAVPPSAGPSAETSAAPSDEASPEPSDAIAPPVRWADCGEGFLCARLPVPKDYADPSKGTLSVSMIRLPATGPEGPHRQPDHQPGRPGRVRASISCARARRSSRRRSGSGSTSSASIREASIRAAPCAASTTSTATRRWTHRPTRRRSSRRWPTTRRRTRPPAASATRDLLPYLSTDAVARDLDLIRQSVGDKQADVPRLLVRDAHRVALRGALPRADPGDGPRRGDRPVARPRALPRGPGARLRDRPAPLPGRLRQAAIVPFHGGGKPAAAFDRLMAAIDRTHCRRRNRTIAGRSVRAWPRPRCSARCTTRRRGRAWPSRSRSRSTATARSSSRSPTRSGAASRTARTPTSRTPTSRTRVSTIRRPTDVATTPAGRTSVQADAPHFAKQVAYNDLTCAFWPVPATGQPHRVSAPGRAADRHRRLDRRSGHAVRVGQVTGRRAGRLAPDHPQGRGPHRLPRQRMRGAGRRCLPGRPRASEGGPDLLLTGRITARG